MAKNEIFGVNEANELVKNIREFESTYNNPLNSGYKNQYSTDDVIDFYNKCCSDLIIKPRLTISDRGGLVDSVIDGAFEIVDENGKEEYYPYLQDVSFWVYVLIYYTNIDNENVSLDSMWDIAGSKLMQKIFRMFIMDSLNDIRDEIIRGIEYKKAQNLSVVSMLSGLFGSLANVLSSDSESGKAITNAIENIIKNDTQSQEDTVTDYSDGKIYVSKE